MATVNATNFDLNRETSAAANRDDNQVPGISSMIEKHHGITERDTAPLKRETPMENDDDDVNSEHKKAKTTFGATNGSILSTHLKAEREKIYAESGPATGPIDSTNATATANANDDDDIIFMGEARRADTQEDNREVCLGKISAKASVFRIPRTSRANKSTVPSEFWPATRVYYRRPNTSNHIIDLIDGKPDSVTAKNFGRLDLVSASALCPLIDYSNVNGTRIKIFVDSFRKQKHEEEGSKVSRALTLSIILFSPRSKAQQIAIQLSQRQIFLSAPPASAGRVEYWNPQVPEDYGANNKKAGLKPQRSSMPSYGVVRTEEDMRRETEGILDKLFDVTDRPEMQEDPENFTRELMPHQRQALHFLTVHESLVQEPTESATGDTGFSLWKPRMGKRGETWYNVITNHELPTKPEPMRGGILADVMGLGKTLSILALIISSIDEARAFGREEPSSDLADIERNSKATLIICPKSVLSNWQEQVKQHTKEGLLKVYTYHGPSRIQDVAELAKYNIVLTTYSTAASEFSDPSKRRNALASIQWFRIVLDEAHQIRTQSTGLFKSCRALEAQRRWALTGTPLQNGLGDLGSLIKFLRLKPFDEGNSWQQHVYIPFKSGREDATDHLHLIVHGITLRRTKDKIELPDRTEKVVRLDFSESEMIDYKLFSQNSNRQLRLMLKGQDRLKGKSYAHVLKALSRLRAYCAHGREMLHEDDMKELEGLTASTAIDLGDEPDEDHIEDDSFISDRHAYDTLHMMTDSDTDACAKCGRKVGDAKADPEADDDEDEDASTDENDPRDILGYLTPCYHLICTDCKDEHVAVSEPKLRVDHYHHCPYCEQYVRFGLFALHRSALKAMLESRRKMNKKSQKERWDESTYSGPSSKVKALLNDLKSNAAETALLGSGEDPIRAVVFSGWTTYLDLIEYALEEHNIGFVRLDGTMSLKARAAVIEDFKTQPTVTVMLVSIKAGGQGLNLVAANKVYMMEPQFNPGVEQQAIDRVHRLGQKRDVKIVHYIMSDSVEEGVLKLQEKKTKLANLSLEKKKMQKGAEAQQRIAELKDLFK